MTVSVSKPARPTDTFGDRLRRWLSLPRDVEGDRVSSLPRDRIEEYEHKLLILKQIMSNKSRRLGRINNFLNVVGVLVSATLTFMGFSGLDKITIYVNWITPASKEKVELVFNLLVFVLFLLIVLQLLFRFGEKQALADRAVVSLTHLINEIGDLIDGRSVGYPITQETSVLTKEKYHTILEHLPPNTDREFVRAKKDFRVKLSRKDVLRVSADGLFAVGSHEQIVKTLLRRSSAVMAILDVLSATDKRLYLGGGIIRNLVWDFLHGYTVPTPIDDVDAIYFDASDSTKASDDRLEGLLYAANRNVKWEVKNQSRMNVVNNDPPYTSLVDAITKWPETATAIIARMSASGEIELIAPYGYDDLFRLLLVPTPTFQSQPARFQDRIDKKRWVVRWPRLRILRAP